MLTIDMNGCKQFLFDRQWWRTAFERAWAFAPQCIVPAVVLTVSNLITVGATAGFMFAMKRLQQNTVTTTTDIGLVLLACIGVLLALIVALLAAFWALFEWMLKLTAFAEVVMNEDADASAEKIQQALNTVKERRGYLMRLWFVASLWLLIPAMPVSLLIGLNSVLGGKQPLMDKSQLTLPPWLLDPNVQMTAQAVSIVLTLIFLAYSMVTIAFSAISKDGPSATAWVALRETMKNLIPLCLLIGALSLVNIVITAPQMVIALTGVDWIHHPAVEAVAQLWLGLTSLVAWPLTMAPVCRLVRGYERA